MTPASKAAASGTTALSTAASSATGSGALFTVPEAGNVGEPTGDSEAAGERTGAGDRPKARRRAAKRERAPAAMLPVARVCVDVNLPHLDRLFDYLVPAEVDGAVQPGVRVRVRFAGQLLDGYVIERVAESEHGGRLAYLERVVSPVRVLTPEVAALGRA
ncbi:MAG TPA: hypothetical protein VKB59_18980, partial [Micromonosporaceae bacterium]|nr:hypothetical protein [Micromonosporaceae bacterium]